jgi:WD40 repeat protein
VFNLKNPLLELQWQGELGEYITALSWSKDGNLAASSAGGEVMVFSDRPQLILPPNQKQDSIDCLGFSHSGQFLAAGGQDAQVRIWQFPELQLVHILDWGSKWVEHLAWHPHQNYLAFSQGRYVQIWDVVSQEIIATLPFENSTVLDFAWNPNGELLAIAGNGGVKIWDSKNWDDDPFYIEMDAAALKIAWSGDGEYLAMSSLDNIVLVWGGGNLVPSKLSGFSGKIRNLAWSETTWGEVPLLATSSVGDIILWQKAKITEEGWNASVLGLNDSVIQDLQFHPQSLLLSSCSEDGYLLLWEKAKNLRQDLTGVSGGFSCLKWNLSGQKLAAGGDRGEVLIFKKI